jgi:hypothetical protein
MEEHVYRLLISCQVNEGLPATRVPEALHYVLMISIAASKGPGAYPPLDDDTRRASALPGLLVPGVALISSESPAQRTAGLSTRVKIISLAADGCSIPPPDYRLAMA